MFAFRFSDTKKAQWKAEREKALDANLTHTEYTQLRTLTHFAGGQSTVEGAAEHRQHVRNIMTELFITKALPFATLKQLKNGLAKNPEIAADFSIEEHINELSPFLEVGLDTEALLHLTFLDRNKSAGKLGKQIFKQNALSPDQFMQLLKLSEGREEVGTLVTPFQENVQYFIEQYFGLTYDEIHADGPVLITLDKLNFKPFSRGTNPIKVSSIQDSDSLGLGKDYLQKLDYTEGNTNKTGFFKTTDRQEDNSPARAQLIGVQENDPSLKKREIAASRVGTLFSQNYPKTQYAILKSEEGQFTDGHIQSEAVGDIGSDQPVMDFGMEPISLNPTTRNRLKNSLVDLQAFDYLIGSVDRNPGNWIATNRNEVLPIDSELSFPEMNGPELEALEGTNFAGLPNTYSDSVKRAVGRMTTAWVRNNLGGLLNPAQLAAFKTRLAAMKEDIRNKANQENVEPDAPQEYVEMVF